MAHQYPPPSITILKNNTQEVILTLKINGMFVEDTTVNGIAYQRISIPREITTTDIGIAEVPILRRLIQIQPQSGVVVETAVQAESLFTNFNIFPAQIPSSDSGPVPPFIKDTVFYNKNFWYPLEVTTTSSPAILTNLRVITLTIHPIAFNPVQQKIKVRKELTVKISFQGVDPRNTILRQPVIYDRSLDLMYRSMVLNYEPQVGPLFPKDERNQWGLNYIILTADQFYDVLQPLIFWKTKKGYTVTIKKLSEVPGYQQHPSDTNKIRNFLRDVVSTQPSLWRTCVLLVGAPDHYTIPLFEGWQNPAWGGPDYSDHYYACLFGDDELEDVYLGRFCITSVEQIETLISKIFAYERNPSASWGKNRVLLVAAIDPTHVYKENKEFIRTTFLDDPTHPIEHTTLYDNLAIPSNISGSLHGLGHGLVNYRGHGLYDRWYHTSGAEVYTVSRIHNLNNKNKYPIVLNVTCSNGAIFRPEETMVEAWTLSRDKGGVGALGATRPVMTARNSRFDIDLFDYLYNHMFVNAQFYSIGGAIMRGRNLMVTYGCPYSLSLARTYLYLGDPTLAIWMTNWGNLQVAHPNYVNVGRETTIQIYVQRWYGQNWGPVRDVRICVYKPNEGFHRRVFTDNTGIARVTIKPMKKGPIYITATYSNCRPYEGICEAIFYAPIITKTNINEASAYNNSRRLLRDAQGTLHLTFTSGDSVYHTFLQDTSWAEPAAIGQSKYPSLCMGADNKLYAISAYNSNSPLFLEELHLVSKDATGWSLTPIPLARTYNSFLWGVGAPSFAIKDTMGYFVFESTYGPTYHPEPGGPMPQVITIQSEALIYGRFSLKNPENCQWQVLEQLPLGPIPVPIDTIVYRDSILPLLISPSITVSPDGVVHILWEGRGDSLRYYRIADTIITKGLYPGTEIDYPFITMRGEQIDHFWCEQGVIRHRYGWTQKTSLSQPQTIASCENPFSSGQYLTWTKQEDGISHLYYGAIPASGEINPIQVNYSTDLISYPQILFNFKKPASLDLVWTEYNQIDSIGFICHLNLPLTTVAPLYTFDMGTEVPVPICVQRDGYKILGPEDYKTLDYASNELIYHLTLHSPRVKYKIRWTYYHEEQNRIRLQFNIDNILHRNRWVKPKEKVTEEAWIPAACLQDNEITIKVKRLSGSIAVLSGFEIETEQVGAGGPQDEDSERHMQEIFCLLPIYQNPTKGLLKIRFNLPNTEKILIKLYDVVGRLVWRTDLSHTKTGENEIVVKTDNLPMGIYFVQVQAGDYSQVTKFINLK